MATIEQSTLESLLGHHFRSAELLERALTHSSWVAEHPAKEGASEPTTMKNWNSWAMRCSLWL